MSRPSRHKTTGRAVLAWWLAGSLALLFPALAVTLPCLLAVQLARWRARRRRRREFEPLRREAAELEAQVARARAAGLM